MDNVDSLALTLTRAVRARQVLAAVLRAVLAQAEAVVSAPTGANVAMLEAAARVARAVMAEHEEPRA